MSSPTPDWPTVVERLEKLERQNRRMKQVGAAVLVLVAAMLLMGQASPNRTVEANEFVLKDANGKMQARLGLTANAPGLTLYEADGEVIRTFLGVGADGPGLYLADAGGKVRAMLSVKADEPSLVLSDRLGVEDARSSELMLCRAEGVFCNLSNRH